MNGTFVTGLVAGLAIGAAAGWFAKPSDGGGLPARAPGSHAMLETELESAPGLSVIVSDVVIPADKSVPKHTHPGEEFVYIIEGEAVHVEEGVEDRVLRAGDAMVIRKGKAHAPRGGASGARAITFRVHPVGEAERTLVE